MFGYNIFLNKMKTKKKSTFPRKESENAHLKLLTQWIPRGRVDQKRELIRGEFSMSSLYTAILFKYFYIEHALFL